MKDKEFEVRKAIGTLPVEIKYIPAQEILDFVVQNNTTIIIEEDSYHRNEFDRDYQDDPKFEFQARISNCNVIKNGMITTTCGRGSTPDEAIKHLALKLSWRKIVWNAPKHVLIAHNDPNIIKTSRFCHTKSVVTKGDNDT